jgi:hypothetical protein
MKKTLLTCILLCAFALQQLLAQQLLPGEVLVKIRPDTDREALWPQLARLANAPLLSTKTVADSWHIYKVSLAPAACADREDDIMNAIRNHADVELAQWNYTVEDRSVEPNDPLWLEQRSMRLIGLTRAWEFSTGGLTPQGDTIVVAVLEKGMQKEHPDLWPNLWRNHGEIPDNNKDDDNNGFVDDYLGWDAGAGKGDGNGTGNSHGTSVCAIVGAKGNEGFGVTGVNWNIKIMTLTNVAQVDEIIAAYNYVDKARARYNSTQGQSGAFVVATNASFGISNAFANDYPLWCAVYNALGSNGVLSVAATANAAVNVDQVGDMPTTCTSPYLISVTNIDANSGKKISSAGYGPISIDIGSPGAGTYTSINRQITLSDTIYHGNFGGTSSSCPHTTGAIGLLYSAPCAGLAADAKTAPDVCAYRVRDLLYSNLRPESTLEEITTQEGRLDVDLAMSFVMQNCAGSVGDLELFSIQPNPTADEVNIKYQTPDFEEKYSVRVFNTQGILMYDKTIAPPQFSAKIETITVRNWPGGTYFIQFGTGKNLIVKKFVKI